MITCVSDEELLEDPQLHDLVPIQWCLCPAPCS